MLNKKIIGLIIGLAVTAAVVALERVGAFAYLELYSFDIRMNMRGPMPAPADIVLVTIDEETRQTMGKSLGQITRADYAKAIDALADAGAKVIAFDVDFASTKEGDEELARSIACAGNVVLSSFIAMGEWVAPNDALSNPDIPCPLPADSVEHEAFVIVNMAMQAEIEWKTPADFKADLFRVFYSLAPFNDISEIDENQGGFADVDGAERSLTLTLQGDPNLDNLHIEIIPMKLGGVRGVGAVNIIEDPDDRVRRLPLIVGRSADDPEKTAALALETAIRAFFADDPKLASSDPSKLVFTGEGKTLDIPVVEGSMIVNFVGGRNTFKRVSFGSVFAGKFDKADFKDKIVLIGNTHQLAHDEYPTPFGKQTLDARDKSETGVVAGFTSGLEIHANAVNTILSGERFRPLGAGSGNSRNLPAVVAALVGIAATLALIVSGLGVSAISALFAAATAALWAAAMVFFNRRGLLLPLAAPTAALVGVYAGALAHRVYVEGREKRWIRDTFGKYLAPSVVKRLIDNPALVELGGEELTLTAFFSDIQGFTSISEELASPPRLVELLNEYLTVMANIIGGYEGTVDKYEGDAIIAFWGAPIHFNDHAEKACRAALDQQAKFIELRETWKSSGKWPASVIKARVRMGVNTGNMVVGNMGSKGRMNYTIMGDAVNLASRLEGVNKQYGSLIMLSEDTYEQVKDKFEVRELDTIRVVGKSKPVKIYELLAVKGQMSESLRKTRELFEEGMAKYRNRDWSGAIESFKKALETAPDDGPSSKYIERCGGFLKNPPAPDWDGVFEMKTK